jgi:hypothetical protein
VGIGRFAASELRADINRIFRVPGNHGFDVTIPLNPGTQTIAVYAINVGARAGNP